MSELTNNSQTELLGSINEKLDKLLELLSINNKLDKIIQILNNTTKSLVIPEDVYDMICEELDIEIISFMGIA